MDNKICRCGHDRNHPWVVPKHKYSFWGWIVVGMGISYPPNEITYECDKCGEVFERIVDRDVLLKNVYK